MVFYADDTMVVSRKLEAIKDLLNEVARILKGHGLNLNIYKQMCQPEYEHGRKTENGGAV